MNINFCLSGRNEQGYIFHLEHTQDVFELTLCQLILVISCRSKKRHVTVNIMHYTALLNWAFLREHQALINTVPILHSENSMPENIYWAIPCQIAHFWTSTSHIFFIFCWSVEFRPAWRKPQRKPGKVNSQPSYTPPTPKFQNLARNLKACNLALSQQNLTIFGPAYSSWPELLKN